MIVVDTNVIAYAFLPGERSSQARSAFLKDPAWSAPLLWRSEFRSVLALYIRKQKLDLDTAIQIAAVAEALLGMREYRVAVSDVLPLVQSSSCSAYDCEFVALAKQLHVPLVTTDNGILKAFPDIAVSLDRFADCGK